VGRASVDRACLSRADTATTARVRIALEDTLELSDGAPASGNVELVRYCLNGS
jgi:uncharacterized protein (DUF849 family)